MGWFSSEEEKREKRQARLNRRLFNADPEIIRAALAAGAEPDALKNKEGQTALFFHAMCGRSGCVKILLEHRADPNIVQSGQSTPLIAAARNAYAECVQLLADHGADLNHQTPRNGWTAMHWAAYWGRGDIVRHLIAKGADKSLTDHQMNTPADIAQRQNHPRLADMIAGRTAVEDAQQQAAADGWRLTGPHEIALTTEKEAIGYRLTQIFNFRTGLYTQIATNLASGAESQTLRSFDEFPDLQAVREAQTELTRRGGAIGPDMAARLAQKPGLKAGAA